MTIRAPHFSRRVEREVQPPEIVPNLLMTTLAVVVSVPFAQHDWPNPQTSSLYEVFQRGQSIRAVAGTPFAQHDWPNPQLEIPAPQPQQVGSPLALIEKAGEKPFAQSDWPNPQIQITQEPVNDGTLLPLITAPRPIIALDWPNPTLEVKIQEPVQAGMPLSILVDAGEKPFAQYDWIVPLGRETVQLEQVGKSIALVESDVAAPFSQHDWPNYQLPWVPQVFHRGLTSIAADPFAQYDWPNPYLEIQIQTPVQVGSPLALIEDAGEKPFAQIDWPNPELPLTQQIEQVGKSVALTEAAVVVPFAQTDWQNPLREQTQQPFSYGSPVVLLPGEKPFAQTEWLNPEPLGLQLPEQVGKSIALIPTQPFTQTDWPNPTLEILVQTPFQLGMSLTILEDAGEKPFAQLDWPIPTVDIKIQTPFQVGSPLSLLEFTFGDIFNAAAIFPTASAVTIELFDPINGVGIALNNNTCTEIGTEGLYIWDSSKLTTQPSGYQEYTWKMTDGITFEGGVIRINAMSVDDLFAYVMENGETYAEQIRLIRADAAGAIVQLPNGRYKIKSADGLTDRIEGDDAPNDGRTISSTDGA